VPIARRRISLSRRRALLFLASTSLSTLLVGGGTPAALAAACDINDVGVTVPTVQNTSTIHCINIQNSTVSGSVINASTGQLLADTHSRSPRPTGIAIDNSAITGDISNSGQISLSSYGILITNSASVSGDIILGSGGGLGGAPGGTALLITNNASVSGDISNSGQVIETSRGLIISNVAQFGTVSAGGGIFNSGTIQVGSQGIAEIASSTIAGGISNSGTISAGVNGILVSRVLQFGRASAGGGIANSGMILGANTGILAQTVSVFAGGITNSGTISGLNTGILVKTVSVFAGGISNSGAIWSNSFNTSLFSRGIAVSNVQAFGTASAGGGISNSGTIIVAPAVVSGTGIRVVNATLFGGITNSGTITAGTAHSVSDYAGIGVRSGGTLAGGILNSGTIVAAGPGIVLSQIVQAGTASAGGGITNSGTISFARTGIELFLVGTFVGGILNSGTLSSSFGFGIRAVTTGSFDGGITNSGVIVGAEGIMLGADGGEGGGVTNSGTISVEVNGIDVGGFSTFVGGISNLGVISMVTNGFGLSAEGISTFSGNIINSGTIVHSNGVEGAGIRVQQVNTFSGDITNSGTISIRSAFGGTTAAAGISALYISTFAGNIINSGTIFVAEAQAGIYVTNIGTFDGGISNTGTITAPIGILVGQSGAVSIFDSGVIVGTGGTAVDLTGNAAGNTFTLGPGYSITGLVKGQGSDTFQLGGTGSGTFDLSNIGTGQQYSGFSAFNVVSGVWTVTGTSATDWTVDGGTFGGTGTVSNLQVNSGATFAPGPLGGTGTFTITGSLTLQSASVYMVSISGASSSSANVSGSATLTGATFAVAAGSTGTVGTKVLVLQSNQTINTQFANSNTLFGSYFGTLDYTTNPDDVYLDISYGTLIPLLPPNPPQNVLNVANAIDNYVTGGGNLPTGFQNLFNFTPAQLESALSQLTGETSTGAGTSTFQLFNDFFNLLSDMALGTGGGGNGVNGGPTGFAEPDDAFPPELALAYNKLLRNRTAQPSGPQNFEQRWTAWGSAYGGVANYDGNAAAGSNNVTASDFGFAGGMDHHAAPDLKLGFALAGGGTNWNVAQNLGSGRSDAFQVAGYGIKHYGPLYFTGTAAFGNSWFTTNRIAAFGDQLRASFDGQSYALRGEAGYRYAVTPMAGLTPYAAIQTQWMHTPGYSEVDLTGGGFGLTYNAQTSNDTRSELGARADDLTTFDAMPLILRARLAWAHDWVSNAALSPVFQALPGSSFTVNGAAVPANSALVSAGGQLFFTTNWSFEAKFDGEFASSAQTYAGTGTLRYSW
jgi:uncharacterized protein with beta-barrel porin domain